MADEVHTVQDVAWQSFDKNNSGLIISVKYLNIQLRLRGSNICDSGSACCDVAYHFREHKKCWMKSVNSFRLILACVAWRFWLGELSNKGGRGQRNCEEIGAGATVFFFFSRLRRSYSRASRANFEATPLLRPARQNRHATQARLIQHLPIS